MIECIKNADLTAKEKFIANAVGRKALFVLEKELGGRYLWIGKHYNEEIANLIGVDKAKQITAIYKNQVLTIPRRFFRMIRNRKIIEYRKMGYSFEDVGRVVCVPEQIAKRIYSEHVKNEQ